MTLIGKTLLASFVLLLGSQTGCASRTMTARDSHENAATSASADENAADEMVAAAHQASAALANAEVDADPRKVGDYVTFAFSGAYRKAPLRLTERVVARTEVSLTIDYTFTENNKSETLRVTVMTLGTMKGDVSEVARVAADGSVKPATRADFDAKMATTAPVADENEALVDTTHATIKVGDTEIIAKKSTYKVRIGAKSATLETNESEAFAWGDLGGTITTSDGKVFYKAELVDAGGPSSARASLE